MRKIMSLAFGMCLTGCMVLLIGCSASEQRAQGRRLREDRNEALQYLERAVSLLESPYYTDVRTKTGNPFPLGQSPRKESDIALQRGELNPEALRALEKAETILQDSLRANAKGQDVDRGLSHSTLARVQEMKGDLERSVAHRAQNRVQALRGEIGTLRDRMEARKTLLGRYQQFLNIPREELEQHRDAALTEAKTLDAEKSKLDAKIKELKAELEKQTDLFIRMEAEASSIRARGAGQAVSPKTEDVQEAMKDVDAALRKQRAADAASAEAARLESQIAIRSAESAEVTAKRDMHNAIAAEAAKILEQRDVRDEDIRKRQEDARKEIVAMQKKAAELAVEMGGACEASAAAEKKAADAYRKAFMNLKDGASANQADSKTPATLASLAQVRMKLAGITLRRLRFDDHNMAFLETLRKTWQAVDTGQTFPAGFEKVDAYVTPEGKETDSKLAAEYLENAVDLYEDAIRKVDAKLSWAYQGQLGAAYLGLRSLTQDEAKKAEYLAQCISILEEARKDREASPYLREVNYLLQVARE